MKDNKQMDDLLHEVFQMNVEPDAALNQRIMKAVKEKKMEQEICDKKYTRKEKAKNLGRRPILIVALCVVALSITVVAAVHLLSEKQVSTEIGDYKLAKAFEGKEAISINKKQVDGDYEVTLMGIVSGVGLSDFKREIDGELQDNASYAVISIAKVDGTSMPLPNDESYGNPPFLVSPLVKGLKPWQYNIFTMNGGYREIVKDGVMYRLIECSNIEMFADRGLYLCVLSNTFYDINAYKYNEETGEMTPNEGFEGVNLLFDLPIPVDKSNPSEAQKFIDELEGGINSEDTQTSNNSDSVDHTQNIENTGEVKAGSETNGLVEDIKFNSTLEVTTDDVEEGNNKIIEE